MGIQVKTIRMGGRSGAGLSGRFVLVPVVVLAMAGLAGCLADDFAVSVGGEATGIAEGTLEITLNNSETVSLDSDGGFEFSSQLGFGERYSISIDAYPDHSHCVVSDAEGIAGDSDISDILVECEVLSLGAANEDQTVQLDWTRSGDVDIAYSTDSGCDWVNVSSCENGGVIADQSGGTLSVDESDGLVADEVYSFVLMVGDQASRPVRGTLSRFELSGAVLDTVIANDRAYAGGEFLLHGAPVQGIARFRSDRDEALLTGAHTDVSVSVATPGIYDTAPAPDGGRFIGGDFQMVNGTARTHVARLNPDGSLDENWSVPIDGNGVTVLLVDEDEGHLYIGGSFTEVDGNTDYVNLARLDLDGNLDTSFGTDSPNGIVWALEASDDLLYLGGDFGQIGAETRLGVGAMDLADGTLDTNFVPELNQQLWAIRHDQDRVFLGGQFTTVNGTSQAHLAVVDAADGTLDTGFEPVVDDTVFALAEIDGDLLIGGGFTSVDGSGRTGLATLDYQTGDLLSDWNVTMNGGVLTLYVDEEFVYIGGEIMEVEGFVRHDLARLHRDTQALDEDWVPLVDADNIWDIEGGDELTVVGLFRGAGGSAVNNLAAFELATGVLDTNFDAGTDRRVRALLADSQQLFVGGDFSETYHDGAVTANAYAAAVDLSDGSDQGWQPSPDARVEAMVFNAANDTVYLGGLFDVVDGEARESLAAVDAVDGTVITTPNPAITGPVYSMSWADSYDGQAAVIIGGSFGAVLGEGRSNHAVVSFDLVDVHPNNLDPDGTVYATAYSSSESYQLMGGSFQNVDGQPQTRFAAFEGDTTFDGSAPGIDDRVRAISIDAALGRVIVGGYFTDVGGDARTNLAFLNYTSGSGLAVSSDTLDTDADVLAIAQDADYVVLGGMFRYVGGERHGGLAILDGTTLDSVLGGASLMSKQAPTTVMPMAQGENPLLDALPSLRR